MPSYWFKGGIGGREKWSFPCVAESKSKNFWIGDSQSKCYGQQQKEKENWLILSYSGADIIELQQILKTGKVWDGNRPIIKKTEREHIDHGKRIALRTLCDKCGRKCGDLITENVIVQCGEGCKYNDNLSSIKVFSMRLELIISVAA